MDSKKVLSFKDFLTVDFTPDEPEQTSWNAKKRKRGVVGESSEIPEARQLSLASRRALARAMKRNKAKIKLARKRALKRTATRDVIVKRATKQARSQVFKKLAKDKSKSDMTPQRRAEIEKRLDRYKGRISKMARKLIPTVRKQDKERKIKKSK